MVQSRQKDAFFGAMNGQFSIIPLGHHNASWKLPSSLEWTQWRSGPGGDEASRRWCPPPLDAPECHHGLFPKSIEG
jgi:hypothetical protein